MFPRKLVVSLVLLATLMAACAGGTGGAPPEVIEPTQAPAGDQTEAEAPTIAPPTADEPMATAEAEGGEGPADTPGPTTYSLVAAESTASFELGEILAGQPNQVVGTSSSLEGAFALDFSQPGATQFGPIIIDADTLVTDDDRRNQAIRRFILQTGQEGNETIVFQPDSASGIPGTVEVGASYPMELSGDLTVHGVTNPVTFTGEVAVPSSDRLEGTFETTVMWADFDIGIPQVPAVAGVDEEVMLTLDFVAVAQ